MLLLPPGDGVDFHHHIRARVSTPTRTSKRADNHRCDKTSIEARPQPSPLLSLPTELRLQIYEHALCSRSRFGIGGHYTNPNTTRKPPRTYSYCPEATTPGVQSSLTLICRQIRDESLPLFYRLNHFNLDVSYPLARNEVACFIKSISLNPTIGENLRSVTIKHRFGMMNFRGVVFVDLAEWRIGNCNFLPPVFEGDVRNVVKEVKVMIEDREERARVVEWCLRGLVRILGA